MVAAAMAMDLEAWRRGATEEATSYASLPSWEAPGKECGRCPKCQTCQLHIIVAADLRRCVECRKPMCAFCFDTPAAERTCLPCLLVSVDDGGVVVCCIV